MELEVSEALGIVLTCACCHEYAHHSGEPPEFSEGFTRKAYTIVSSLHEVTHKFQRDANFVPTGVVCGCCLEVVVVVMNIMVEIIPSRTFSCAYREGHVVICRNCARGTRLWPDCGSRDLKRGHHGDIWGAQQTRINILLKRIIGFVPGGCPVLLGACVR